MFISQLKLWIQSSNFRHVEKFLLHRENITQTLRLALGDGFLNSDPDLTVTLKRLYQGCPSVFESVLPVADRYTHEEKEEGRTEIIGDKNHKDPIAALFLQPIYVRTTLKLPQSAADLKDTETPFNTALRNSYRDDYGSDIATLGKHVLKWCKRLSFIDK